MLILQRGVQRVNSSGQELEQLRRELLRGLAGAVVAPARKPTLYGSVQAGDVTDAMIDEAQRDLLRPGMTGDLLD